MRHRLDIGSGKGRCTDGGLGIDLSLNKARTAHEAGHLVVVADATLPIVRPKSFEEATLFHVLEHLSDLGEVTMRPRGRRLSVSVSGDRGSMPASTWRG